MVLPEKRILISDLCKVLNAYMPEKQVQGVYRAYIVAATAHDGQYRRSGEAYVFHPINVAMILAELKLDCYCIVAALLHDCIEDTTLTQVNIVEEFGVEVAHIVEGVSKLTGLEFHSNIDQQAQNFRKLFLAMSTDMRVMMIKLADRLHNMRTLKSVSRKKQLRIAKETAEIHAPIARRLGLNSIKMELEMLCFEFIYPYRYKVLNHQINKRYGNLKEVIVRIQDEIEHRLTQEGLDKIKISGRRKATYSIYEKMKVKRLKFSQVLDMYAFRVIVSDVAQCYQALGIIHNLYKPFPGKFKDYVALPKSNGYQSLHTVLFGPNKIFIEVQIRSKDMDFISEYGIAAHWHYKGENSNSSELANNWLGSLLDIQQNSDTSIEFLEETKADLFPSEVFVFTPKGEIIQLPHKSSALDFAYSIHTNVGNQTLKAKIDQVEVPLSSELKSGQTIEIITDKNTKPRPSWLGIVATVKAKASIKTKLKEESASELIRLGEYLLTNALNYQGNGEPINEKKWQGCLTDLKCNSKQELYIKIALSELLVSFVLNKLQAKSGETSNRISIKKTKGEPISFARCCYPIPGDKVAGILTSSKGLVLHRFDCGNLIHAKHKGEQWLEVDWQADEDEEFEVLIRVQIENRRGMLASIANAIAKININIEHLEVEEHDYSMKAMNFVISVSSHNQLDKVMYVIKSLEHVHSVIR
ncbi:MAG: bifunctional (p)ppGpp synthetase/guanosine-3',5'-bis(diphosphate) 3'-pyrophosphohydrolase [Gammaproteobacteria bacterium]|nr:bifunctional (p)ppGpp synthetase/guanosine-3',5'-bis(diphosphate) 3'-pyrophosphohydrolase [Gammaproteobacteria bacterium]